MVGCQRLAREPNPEKTVPQANTVPPKASTGISGGALFLSLLMRPVQSSVLKIFLLKGQDS